MFDRVIVLVLDGCGAGSAPDAADFNDIADN
jgi:phosphopentomutase